MSTTASHLLSVGRSGVAAPEVGLLDSDGLAGRLGVTHRFVRRLVEERRIPFHKIGRLPAGRVPAAASLPSRFREHLELGRLLGLRVPKRGSALDVTIRDLVGGRTPEVLEDPVH